MLWDLEVDHSFAREVDIDVETEASPKNTPAVIDASMESPTS